MIDIQIQCKECGRTLDVADIQVEILDKIVIKAQHCATCMAETDGKLEEQAERMNNLLSQLANIQRTVKAAMDSDDDRQDTGIKSEIAEPVEPEVDKG